jgi:cytochrome bd-type quinol oxidase subunit 2
MNNLESVARGSYDVNTNENTLLDNIATIIQVVLGLLGTIFVILMIYAGILWMTAGGNDTQVKKAQNIIQRAAIGLLIVVLAYAITYFIFQNLPNGGESGGQGSA